MNFRERFGGWFGGEESKKSEAEKPEIEKSEKEENPFSVIEKPTDEELLGKLERKLEEYRNRTENHPVTFYKIAVLESLLNNGRVNYRDLEHKLQDEQKDGFDNNELFQAFMVINSYVSGNLGGIRGGTGLK